MDERLFWLGVSNAPLIGPKRFSELLSAFNTAESVWKASAAELLNSGLGPKITERFVDFRRKFSPEAYFEKMQKKNVNFITKKDSTYPYRLLQIPNPPNVLYIKGNFDFNNNKYVPVAVVGTRKVTEYGRSVTEQIVGDLARAGIIIISGLALGVDAIAHRAALNNDSITIAVLGCGVDCCSPRENESLYQRILHEHGVIISEAPLSMMPAKGSFPSRNRIIAGLSDGVLVTEGAEDSGSLITANNAFAFRRQVFAVPGPINSAVSKGPIALLRDGAELVTSAQDIMSTFHQFEKDKNTARSPRHGDTVEEQQILDLLSLERLHFNDVVKKTRFDVIKVGALLSVMEMKGMIKSLEAGMYAVEDLAD